MSEPSPYASIAYPVLLFNITLFIFLLLNFLAELKL